MENRVAGRLPLDGIRVLDLSGHASGPMCAMVLGDFGAEVIKVEAPRGDHARAWGTARFGKKKDISSEFGALNRNKSSIVIDLKNPRGLALAKELVKKSDVVLENFKPGVLERLGLGYSVIAELNAKAILCSISAFGQTGPLSARPGFDLLMQAYAGALSITGEPDRPAVRIGPSTIDFMTASHGVIGIMMALRERDHSGKGQHVDTSLYESAIVQMTHMILDSSATGVVPGRWGPYFPFLAPYGIFAASDREFYLGASTNDMWKRLIEAIGRQDLFADPRFTNNSDRARNQDALYEIMVPIFKSKTAKEWIDLATELKIPHSLIHSLGEVIHQPQALAREAVVPVEGIPGGVSAGIPIKLSRTPGQIRKAPPSLGEDTDAVLKRLGYAESDIAELREAGAMGGAKVEAH
jgi:crotonobetainyl-CoA:carnitine CoA-transferase CaiB-like acyl-CoA transferase